jgi:hypothetical protein
MSTTSEIIERLKARARLADRRKAGADYNGMSFMAEELVETAAELRAAAARLDELERENARMRDLLSKLANRPTTVPVDAEGLAILCRAALAGSGEK